MPKVNEKILVWARETAGLSPDEAAAKLQIQNTKTKTALEKLADLESGEVAPSRPMLVKMSKQYRRPLLTFYMAMPPRKGDRGEDFRTLPKVTPSANALVDAAVRDIRARQSLVRDLLEAEDEAAELEFVGSASVNDRVSDLAKRIADQIGFDRAEYRRQSSTENAVAYLREQVESAGIFVLFVDNLGNYLTEIPVEAFRGFALADKVAPFIAVNANDSAGAKAFTIAHELTHIWTGATGVSGRDSNRETEKFCNDVAGEFLVPRSEMRSVKVNTGSDLNEIVRQISEFASDRRVSKTMIAYKLNRSGSITIDQYQAAASLFRRGHAESRAREREKNRATEGGPTYPIIKKHRAGTALVRFVDRMLSARAITTIKAGQVLGVSGKNVHGVIEAARKTA